MPQGDTPAPVARGATAELATKVEEHPEATVERPSTIHSFAISALLRNSRCADFPTPFPRGGENDAVRPLREHVVKMTRSMMVTPETQPDLFAWADELELDRDRVAQINAERSARRGYLRVRDRSRRRSRRARLPPGLRHRGEDPNQAGRQGYARSPEGRRLRAYLATGRYREELADTRWVI